jgi:hypothetical protein
MTIKLDVLILSVVFPNSVAVDVRVEKASERRSQARRKVKVWGSRRHSRSMEPSPCQPEMMLAM